LNDKKAIDKLLVPTLNFRYFGKVLNKELSVFMYEKFGISRKEVIRAIRKADELQVAFEQDIEIRGQEVLKNLPDDKEALVILGRPYNTGDPALNLSMVEKLIRQDVLPIPMDFLPLKS